MLYYIIIIRDELSKLRQEESHYLHQVETGKRQLDTLMMNLRTVQGDTNQVNTLATVTNQVNC